MAGRGKLIAVIGDEDTVTGFLLGGIGELNKNRQPNFLVVEKDTTINEIEDTFRYGSPRGLNGTLCLGWERGEQAGAALGPGGRACAGLPGPDTEGQGRWSGSPSGGGLCAPSSLLGLGRTRAMSSRHLHMTVSGKKGNRARDGRRPRVASQLRPRSPPALLALGSCGLACKGTTHSSGTPRQWGRGGGSLCFHVP